MIAPVLNSPERDLDPIASGACSFDEYSFATEDGARLERNPAKCERFADRLRDNQRNPEHDPITFNRIML